MSFQRKGASARSRARPLTPSATGTAVQVGKCGGSVGLSESGGCVLAGGTVASASALPLVTVILGGAFHAVVSGSRTDANEVSALNPVLPADLTEANPVPVIVEDWVDRSFSSIGVIPSPIVSIQVDVYSDDHVAVALGFEDQGVISFEDQVQTTRQAD